MKQDTKYESEHSVLVADGQSRTRVVLMNLNDALRPHCHDAVVELLRGIALSTGVRIYVDGGEYSLEPVRPAPVALYFKPLSTGSDLGPDGFRICVSAEEITIEARHRSGFSNAVYTFLERYCGFRWLWPGDDGEVFTRQQELRIPVGMFEERPDYQWRHLLHVDMPDDTHNKWGIMEFHMMCASSCDAHFRQWMKRNRMGGRKGMIGHTWGRFVSPFQYARSNPEFFAEINGVRGRHAENFNGKHGAQLCTSNPQVVDLMVQRIRESFDQDPELDIVSISPNDGKAFCECDACIALDVAYGNSPPIENAAAGEGLEATLRDDVDMTSGGSRITGPITDRLFDFANRVAARIAESHPGKDLLLLVYGPYRDPPRHVRLADNVIAQYCVRCHQHSDKALRKHNFDAISALTRMAGKTGIYEYFDQGAWPAMPRSFPDLIADAVRYYHDQGVRHFSTQAGTGFAANGFNLWFLSRVLWDTRTDVDDALTDYCARGFGRGADAMQTYFNLWRERFRECKGFPEEDLTQMSAQHSLVSSGPFETVLKVYPPSFMDSVNDALDRALEAVDSFSPEYRRICFFGRAVKGIEIVLEASRVSYALRDQGWPLVNALPITAEKIAHLGPPATVLQSARKALRLWNRWEAFLESVRNDFVFSFFWARANYDYRRKCAPHAALQQIVDLLSAGGRL